MLLCLAGVSFLQNTQYGSSIHLEKSFTRIVWCYELTERNQFLGGENVIFTRYPINNARNNFNCRGFVSTCRDDIRA